MPPKKNPKGGRGKKKKQQQEVEDEFTTQKAEDIMKFITENDEELNKLKVRRNYIQMDKDMVEQYYQNTNKEIEETKIKISNIETEMEEMEAKHQVSVKVYLQKVKHLEYEQEQTNQAIQQDGEGANQKEDECFDKKLITLSELKQTLKQEFQTQEKQNIEKGINKNTKNLKELQADELEFEKKIDELIEKYEQKLKDLKEELELKLKVELHELEERKNLHINELISNHEKAFAELKQYYNEITRENLDLIKAQKEEMKRISEALLINKKLIAEMKDKNEQLKKPLEEKQAIRDQKLKELKQFPKDKMSLANLKSKFITLKHKVEKLELDFKELNKRYDKVMQERKYLDDKFENITSEVKKHSEWSNLVLEQKLSNLESQMLQKEEQLRQIMANSNIDANLYKDLSSKIKDSIEQKNQMVKSLQYSIHHATKAYNDAIRVYEAKLNEFGIPPDELGFQLLETITSTMPAGLVSS